MYDISYILVLVLFLFSIFYKVNICTKGEYNENILDKQYTDCVKGIMIITIVIHHLAQKIANPGVIYCFSDAGYLCVSVFFFYSGYGLIISKIKKSDYLKMFWYKRIFRVMLPFVLVNIFFLILYYLLLGKIFSITDIIFNIVGISLFDNVMWYVVCIIIFYCIFYIAFSYLDETKALMAVFIFSAVYVLICYKVKMGVWWFDTAFCFSAGIVMGKYKNRLLKILKSKYSCLLFVSLLGLIVSQYKKVHILNNMLASMFFLIFLMSVLYKIKINNKILKSIGNISFEIYLIHMKIYTIYTNYFDIKNGINFILYFILIIILAAALKKVLDVIFEIIPGVKVNLRFLKFKRV